MIVDNDGMMWLNEKLIEEGLDNKHLREITTKYHSDHRKHRCELVEKQKKQINWIFMNEQLAPKMIMDCRATLVHKFRKK